jgi:hypothetical protein
MKEFQNNLDDERCEMIFDAVIKVLAFSALAIGFLLIALLWHENN